MGSTKSCCQNNEDQVMQAVAVRTETKLPTLEDNFSKMSPNKQSHDHKVSKSTFNLTTQAGRTAPDAQDLFELMQDEHSQVQADNRSQKGDTRPLQQIDNEFSIAGGSDVHERSVVCHSLMLADLSVIQNH